MNMKEMPQNAPTSSAFETVKNIGKATLLSLALTVAGCTAQPQTNNQTVVSSGGGERQAIAQEQTQDGISLQYESNTFNPEKDLIFELKYLNKTIVIPNWRNKLKLDNKGKILIDVSPTETAFLSEIKGTDKPIQILAKGQGVNVSPFNSFEDLRAFLAGNLESISTTRKPEQSGNSEAGMVDQRLIGQNNLVVENTLQPQSISLLSQINPETDRIILYQMTETDHRIILLHGNEIAIDDLGRIKIPNDIRRREAPSQLGDTDSTSSITDVKNFPGLLDKVHKMIASGRVVAIKSGETAVVKQGVLIERMKSLGVVVNESFVAKQTYSESTYSGDRLGYNFIETPLNNKEDVVLDLKFWGKKVLIQRVSYSLELSRNNTPKIVPGKMSVKTGQLLSAVEPTSEQVLASASQAGIQVKEINSEKDLQEYINSVMAR